MRFLLQDLHYAVRLFGKRRAFAGMAILVIGLGVGAGTAVFTLVRAVLIESLPFENLERLVILWHQDLKSGRDRVTLAPADYADYVEQSRAFDAIGAARGVSAAVQLGDRPEAIDAVQVTGSIFTTLGIEPLLGRTFAARGDSRRDDADSAANAARERVAVVSYAFWQRAFGGDPGVLGRTMTLRAGFTASTLTTPGDAGQIDGVYTIIGVLPPRVSLPYRNGDVWIPLPPERGPFVRAQAGLVIFARLRPGVSLDEASADSGAIAQRLALAYPERHRNETAWLAPLRQEDVGDIAPTLRLLALSVALLALIVCATVGNMLLIRTAERRRELEIRLALGATRRRLARQLLTESALLAAAGAALGVLLASWLTRLLAVIGPDTIPRLDLVRVDPAAPAGAIAIAGVMTIGFGLAPALQASRSASRALSLRSGNAASTGRRLREWLIAGEVALAFVVLAGAGMVIASAFLLEGTRIGYEPGGVLTFRVALPAAKYADASRRAELFDRLLARLRQLPGVSAAGAVTILPQMDTNRSVDVEIDGRLADAASRTSVRFRIASPGYFKSLGTPLLQGRDFTSADLTQGVSQAGAVIVSRSMRDRYWPGENPIGHRLRLRLAGSTAPEWQTIVGVVEDVRQWIVTPGEPTVYWANLTQPGYGFAIRPTRGRDPMQLASAIPALVREIDPDQPVFDVRSLDDRLTRSQQFAYARFRTAIMTLFGIAALWLTCLGIYGVVRYSVMQRLPEFGIRVALGASPRDIVRLMLAHAARPVALGAAAGLAAALATGRLLASTLYGIAGFEPIVIGIVALVLAASASLAMLGPARRAGAVDPSSAVRGE